MALALTAARCGAAWEGKASNKLKEDIRPALSENAERLNSGIRLSPVFQKW